MRGGWIIHPLWYSVSLGKSLVNILLAVDALALWETVEGFIN